MLNSKKARSAAVFRLLDIVLLERDGPRRRPLEKTLRTFLDGNTKLTLLVYHGERLLYPSIFDRTQIYRLSASLKGLYDGSDGHYYAPKPQERADFLSGSRTIAQTHDQWQRQIDPSIQLEFEIVAYGCGFEESIACESVIS